MNVVIWGTGKIASKLENYINYEKIAVMDFVDNNERMWGRKRILYCTK